MSSITSESTLAGETPPTTVLDPGACWVASEDLSSMVFQTAYLQRITSSWNGYVPLVFGETLMKRSLKKCQDTVDSLRSTLESLEVKAAKAAQPNIEEFMNNWHLICEGPTARAAKETKSVLSGNTPGI